MDRRALVILVVVAVELCLRLVYQGFAPGVSPLLFTLAARLVELALMLGLAFDLSGVRARSPAREILIGAGVALVFGATVILTDLGSRTFLNGGALRLVIGRQQIAEPLVFLLTGCIVAPFAEEIFFRGLLYSWIRSRMPIVVAVLFSALLFAGMHGFFSPVQLVGGLIFAGLYEWRGSVWAPWTVHAAANLGIWVLPWIHPWWPG